MRRLTKYEVEIFIKELKSYNTLEIPTNKKKQLADSVIYTCLKLMGYKEIADAWRDISKSS